MNIELLDSTKLSNVVIGARTCWDSFHKGGNYDLPTNDISEEDFNLLNRLINKHKHESVSEHLVFVFSIKGISRACLQELARHRIQSLSVKSSRYTIGRLKEEESFLCKNVDGHMLGISMGARERALKYIVPSSSELVRDYSIYALENLRKALLNGLSNDVAKYCMPESMKTDLVSTFNFRSFKNFYTLRNSKDALPEIRQLAINMFDVLPDRAKELLIGKE